MDKITLEKLVSEKLSTRKIAEKLSTSQTNINYWLGKYELKTDKCKQGSTPYRLTQYKFKCLFCETEGYSNQKYKKYCNLSCQQQLANNLNIQRWKSGEDPGYCGENIQLKNWVRKYLLDKYSNACIKCGWNEIHPIGKQPLVEINHIDGNATNCNEENLEVLCRNCHSMTFNFGSRNKNGMRPKKQFKPGVA